MEFDTILRPANLWSPTEVLNSPSPVPRLAGLYGWYFADPPPSVPLQDCIYSHGRWLLYVGICPAGPPPANAEPTRRTLRERLRTHIRGRADASTLRLTLGCILIDELELTLSPRPTDKRLDFGTGEDLLTGWIAPHGSVVWMTHSQPWTLEIPLIRAAKPPLNLAHNQAHPFHNHLSKLRRECTRKARSPWRS